MIGIRKKKKKKHASVAEKHGPIHIRSRLATGTVHDSTFTKGIDN